MPDTIKTGTILIKDGTLLPESLRFESEPCVPGWRFLGVCYVTVSAQSRHIQDSAFLFQAKGLLVRDGARSAAA